MRSTQTIVQCDTCGQTKRVEPGKDAGLKIEDPALRFWKHVYFTELTAPVGAAPTLSLDLCNECWDQVDKFIGGLIKDVG